MGIRETFNKNPIVVGAAVAVAIAACVLIATRTLSSTAYKAPENFFFTTDDGATYFADSRYSVPPYSRDGKEAVQAKVYACADGKPFVGYLVKYTNEGRTRIDKEYKDAMSNAKDGKITLPPMPWVSGVTLVKKPGGKEWVASMSREGQQATSVSCPSGSDEGFHETYP